MKSQEKKRNKSEEEDREEKIRRGNKKHEEAVRTRKEVSIFSLFLKKERIYCITRREDGVGKKAIETEKAEKWRKGEEENIKGDEGVNIRCV